MMNFDTKDLDKFTLKTPDPWDMMNNQFRRIALDAADKTVLTDEEKLAICWVAGVPCEVVPVDLRNPDVLNKVTFRTAVDCAVTRIDGKWHVTQANPNHPKKI